MISWEAHPVAPAKKGCLLEKLRQFISINTWIQHKEHLLAVYLHSKWVKTKLCMSAAWVCAADKLIIKEVKPFWRSKELLFMCIWLQAMVYSVLSQQIQSVTQTGVVGIDGKMGLYDSVLWSWALWPSVRTKIHIVAATYFQFLLQAEFSVLWRDMGGALKLSDVFCHGKISWLLERKESCTFSSASPFPYKTLSRMRGKKSHITMTCLILTFSNVMNSCCMV